MLQNRYPKHPLESTHSTHRSQTTDLLPIAMKISDPKETQKKEEEKKRLDWRIRTGDKLASLEYSTLMSLPESSYFQILKTKQKAWIRGATTNEDQSRTSHSSPWNFQILKLREIQKRNLDSIQDPGATTIPMWETYSYCCCCCCCYSCCWWWSVRIDFYLCWFIMTILRTRLSTIEESFWWKSSGAANYCFLLSTADDNDDAEQRTCGKHQRQVLFVFRLLARPHPRAQNSFHLGRYLKVHSHLVLGTLVLSPLTTSW